MDIFLVFGAGLDGGFCPLRRLVNYQVVTRASGLRERNCMRACVRARTHTFT